LQIADALDAAAAKTFGMLESLRKPAESDAELQRTINDCEALGWLGRYYAAKIRGACDLALFDATKDIRDRDSAIQHLNLALNNWKHYAAVRDSQYVPALYNRVGYVDVTALTERVAADIDIARNWVPGSLKGELKGADTEKGFRN
jgi:hypothetical protein